MKRIDLAAIIATTDAIQALLATKPAVIIPDPPCEGFDFFSNYSHARFMVDGPPWTIDTLSRYVATSARVDIYDVLVIDHPAMHPGLRFAVFVRRPA